MTTTTIPMPNITSVYDLAAYANTATNTMFWNGLILVIWMILFLSLKGYRSESALLAASFVSMILAVFLAILGLANPLWVVGFLLATAAGAFMLGG